MTKVLTKLAAGVVLGLLGALIIWVVADLLFPGLFYAFEARTYDWRVQNKIADVPEQSIEEIIIIDIDGRSVSELGKFSQWPRDYYPRVLRFLKEGRAKSIGLDIIFDRDMRDAKADSAFVEEVAKADNVFNAVYFSIADSLNWRYAMAAEPAGFDWQKYTYDLPAEVANSFRPEERFENEFIELLNASHAVGHVNFEGDVDGVVRRIYLFTRFNNHFYPSLAFKIYLDQMGIDRLQFLPGERLHLFHGEQLVADIPLDERNNMIVNYAGPFKTFRYISFYDVLEQRLPKEYFEGKTVLVGTSLPGLFDLRSVPFQPAFPGVEIHANILNTLANQNFVDQLSQTENLIMLISIGILAGVITIFLSPLWSIVVMIILGIVHTVITSYLFETASLWVAIVNPILTLVVTFSAVYLYKYITEEQGKKFIRDTFSHFVTASVVEELLANPDKIKLGGEKKVCTVFFSDVAGFTTISEQLSPEALVTLLNEYLTEMTNIVFKYNGMLDKYEGDAIMAVFGAPIAHGNHAYNACAAALEMQEKLVELRLRWSKEGRPLLHARMGINTGAMVVGNMGSETRFDYTVMGDAVNLGARLEPANKQYGTSVMIGPETWKMANENIIARQLDLLRVKGKTQPVDVYELVGIKSTGVSKVKLDTIDFFNKGFENYLAQNWDWAVNYFRQALNINPADGPSQRYLKRCQQYKQNPPAEGWDGVYTMTTK